ncbi:cytochrome P450 family protein [Marininema halotolerans]|uniref:Cytochrome P450 n=1 Tax=Marininema halotolerans TaxID=1155944 RepID=A0A1I6TMN6_9BACL|nr:cytochrome P450 [Marininema halotolerans]SFS90513.1 Cytochrome P450 [Marininema halotolerans]
MLQSKTIEPLSIDFFAPDFKEHALTIYQGLRDQGAIHPIQTPWDEPAWFIVQYDAVQIALKDQKFLMSPQTVAPEHDANHLPEELDYFSHHLLTTDPPEHSRLRTLVHKAFTPRMIARLQTTVETICDQLLDEVTRSSNHTADLITQYAFPIPIIVISDMLGIPQKDRDLFREWSKAMLSVVNRPEVQKEVRPQLIALRNYLTDLFVERRNHPQEDLVSALIEAEDNGDRLSEEELYSMIMLLVIAGHETTVNLIGNGIYALLQHPDQLTLLKKSPSLINSTVEEILRYYSPVEMATNRWGGEAFSFEGQTISPGDLVLICIGSANRDKRRFTNPDQFDITRHPNPHLAFGMGIHYCLGAPLARLEGQIALPRLFDRLPNLQLDFKEESLPWQQDFLMRGLTHLPVHF